MAKLSDDELLRKQKNKWFAETCAWWKKEFLKRQFKVEKLEKFFEAAKKSVDESELENNPNCEII